MRSNILYLGMVSGLGAVLVSVIPAGINPFMSTETREEPRSILQLDLASLQDRLGIGPKHDQSAIPISGMTDVFDERKIDGGMTVAALVAAFGEPIIRSKDGSRWSYSDTVVIVSGDNVVGWIDHEIDINFDTAFEVEAHRSSVSPKSKAHAPQFAGRMLNPFSTRSVSTTSRASSNGNDYSRVTTRDRLRSARFDVRRRTLRASAKPAWLRAFGESLDRSSMNETGSGVLRSGQANFRHINYSRSGQ